MERTYDNVKKLLGKVHFGEIWPDFHLYPFALYEEESACMDGKTFPRPECFRGNTTVEYRGERIAIWKVDRTRPKEDMDILTACIVHEMFHAFQMERGESRFPNDLAALRYPADVENFARKLQENQTLAKAFRERDIEKKRKLLACFCRLRSCRGRQLGKFVECECLAETAEGLAEYAGTAALGMLSGRKQEQRTEKYLQLLENLSPLLFDVRAISYYVGAILAMAAKDSGLAIEHSIGSEVRSLYRVIADEAGDPQAETAEETVEKEAVRVMLDAQIAGKKQRIEEFFARDRRKVTGAYQICGYDPVNMCSADRRILGTHFFWLRDEKTGEIVTLEGESVLEMSEETDRVNAYWR